MVGGQYLASRWKLATHTTAPASFGQGWYEGQRAPAQGRHHIATNILKSRAHFRAFFDSLTVEAHKDLRCLARCARPAFPLDDDSDSPPVHDLETLEQKTDRHESERDFLREAMNKLGFTSVHGWNFKLPVVAQLAQMGIWSVHV